MAKGFGQKRNVFALVIKDLKKFQEKIGFNLVRKQKKLQEYIQ